MNMLVLEL